MLSRKLALLLTVLLPSSTAVLAMPAVACASSHIRIVLTGFDAEGATRFAYLVEEPSGSGTETVTILAGGDSCGENVWVTYSTVGGTATPSADYEPVGATTAQMFLGLHESAQHPVPVTINGDSDPTDAHVESLGFVLSNPQNASLGVPSTAPILIVDVDFSTRVGFEGVPYTQSESSSAVRIPVFRAGDAGVSTSVNYTVSPSGASPATPGQDFTGPESGSITFAPGDRWKSIDLSILNDSHAEGEETFDISLSGPVNGDIVAGAMTFTILDNEESDRPTSRLHHPRHGWRYKKSDYRIREIHIFASDPAGVTQLASGIVAAQLALRKNMKNGTCRWWTGEAWEQKDCQNREWLETQHDPVGELYRYRMKQLKSSVKTRIKNYTAFSRAIDGAGNIEKDFAEKRNANTFEVKRRRSR